MYSMTTHKLIKLVVGAKFGDDEVKTGIVECDSKYNEIPLNEIFGCDCENINIQSFRITHFVFENTLIEKDCEYFDHIDLNTDFNKHLIAEEDLSGLKMLKIDPLFLLASYGECDRSNFKKATILLKDKDLNSLGYKDLVVVDSIFVAFTYDSRKQTIGVGTSTVEKISNTKDLEFIDKICKENDELKDKLDISIINGISRDTKEKMKEDLFQKYIEETPTRFVEEYANSFR